MGALNPHSSEAPGNCYLRRKCRALRNRHWGGVRSRGGGRPGGAEPLQAGTCLFLGGRTPELRTSCPPGSQQVLLLLVVIIVTVFI